MFSDPVVGHSFFGRQEIIDLLIKRAKALKSGYRQNVAIIGHQQLGKTSILRHFLHSYKDPDTILVYVEIKIQALDYFIDQFIRSLLLQHLNSLGPLSATLTLSQMTEKAQASIPKTVARIQHIVSQLKQRHQEEAYSRLFELTSSLKEETGKTCIVILDEFHRLGEFGVKNAFADFGKRIMLQKETMYVLSSSSFSASRKILAEKLSLLFGNFERVYLKPFDFPTAFAFLDKKLAPMHLSDNLKYFLVAFTDGHPFFLDTFARRLREKAEALGEMEIHRGTLINVFMSVLFESQGILNQYFLKLLSPWTSAGSRGSHILILVEIAKGNNKLKEISAALNRSQRDASNQITELMAHELVIKNGVFYRFHDKIFKFWLREVYQAKELALFGEGKDRDFWSRVDETIREYEEMLKLGTEQRVLELFKEFRNELVEFGEKGRQLPHFTQVLPVEKTDLLTGSTREIIARGHGRCWVCKIVEEKATEKEVLDLVREQHHGTPTRVLIALKGLDDTGKLLAKEKKVLTLGLSRINMLLDIYGKSPIIPAVSSSQTISE